MTQSNQMSGPIRFCTVCKVADDSPRHDIFGTEPNIAPHMECCAKVGCPDGSCDVNIWIAACADQPKGAAGPTGNVPNGDKLREFLTDPKNREVLDPLLDERDDGTRHFTHSSIDATVHGSITQEFIALQPTVGDR